MGWAGAGLAGAAGSLVGLLVGGFIGGKLKSGEGPVRTIEGTSVGALVGMAAGAFAGAALATGSATVAGPSTIVVNPNPPLPGPPSPPVLPPNPPPPPNPGPAPGADPILSDAQSVYAARNLLGQWWARVYAQTPSAVNNQLYTPVLTTTGGALDADPNFVNALSFFQQDTNINYGATVATTLGVAQLPYVNGTLDTYTLQMLNYFAQNPNA